MGSIFFKTKVESLGTLARTGVSHGNWCLRESWDIEQSRLLLKRPRSADTILIKFKKKILKRTKPATGGWEQACWSSNKVKSNPTACKGLQKAEHGVSGWNTVAMWETQMKLLLLACPSLGHFSHLGSEPADGKPPSASPYLSVNSHFKTNK